MPRIRTINRKVHGVGIREANRLEHVEEGIRGWEVNMDQEVNWHFVIQNHTDREILLVEATPFTIGPWGLVRTFPVHPHGLFDQSVGVFEDNEDRFFYFRQADDSGTMQTADASEAASHLGEMREGGSAIEMYWTTPHGEIIFTIWAGPP